MCLVAHLAIPIRWYTGEDEQSGFAMMDTTEQSSDHRAFFFLFYLAETFIHINIKQMHVSRQKAEGGC